MAAQNNNLVDNIVDTQKKVLDNAVENAKKFATGNPILNETIEKGSDWYKTWLESQKTLFSKAANVANGAAAQADKKAAGTTENANEFVEQWMNTQAGWAKQIWEMSQEAAKKFGANTSNPWANFQNTATNQFSNWQNTFGNANNPLASWMNNVNGANQAWNNFNNANQAWNNWNTTANNWAKEAQGFNPFNNETYKQASANVAGLFNQYYSTLNSTATDWQKNFQNGTMQDAYKNMVNSAEGFTKFAELWMPMIKSMQEKTFSMDEYKKLMNPDTYKEFMDKFFGFMPESSREYINKMTAMMNENISKAGDGGMNNYRQMRDMMSKMTGGNGSEVFGNVQNAYNNWQGQINEAFAPFTKMMTPNQQSKAMQEWKDISDRTMAYNLKNAELQYMIYTQGAKVMDKLAEYTAAKVKDGGSVTSIVDLYQDWMNISDKVYVSLFESTEYSELMAEVAAMQMKLKKDIELQSEKLLKDIPVATRSELDEVYKTLYELKKQVRQLEKMLDLENDEEIEEETAPKKTAKKTTRK